MFRYAIACFLLGCLVFQVTRLNPPSLYPEAGERAPFDLSRGGETISQLSADCLTGFVVSPDCPFCQRLAASFTGLEEGVEEPIWIVIGEDEVAREFSDEYSLSPSLVYSLTTRKTLWPFSRSVPTIPFTPLRIIIDRNLVIVDLSQSQSIPPSDKKAELCAQKP
jgi:hypothetical protein